MFRAAVEPRRTGWNLRPSSANTVDVVQRRCRADGCRDEINLHIADPNLADNYCHGQEGDGNSHKRSYDRVCIGMNGDNIDPFRIVHEIGHNVQRRYEHYETLRLTQPGLPDISSVMALNCMDRSEQGVFDDPAKTSDVRHCNQGEDYESCP